MFASRCFQDRYDKLVSMGRGTFGECFTCRSKTSGEILFVKEVDYKSLGSHSPQIARLRGELEKSIHLRHRNILPVLEVYDDPDLCIIHIISPYRAGESVTDLIASVQMSAQGIPEQGIWRFMDGLCQALQFLCTSAPSPSTSPAHLNLTPSNIFLSSLSSVLISEPCITRFIFDVDSIRRDEAYVPPETRGTAVATLQGNIWTVGSIAYELATGKRASDLVSSALSANPKIELPEQYSMDLSLLISQMVSSNEDKRPSLAYWRSAIREFEKRKGHLSTSRDIQHISPTELMIAVTHLDIDRVYRYLSQHSARVAGGTTALMLAAEQNFPAAVSLLLKYEAGLCNDDGDTALLLACKKDYQEVVKLLAPVEGHIRDAAGLGAIHVCKKYKAVNSLRSLLDLPVEQQYGVLISDDTPRKKHRAYRNTTLHAAVLVDDVRAIEQNIELSGIFSSKGRTALSLAAENGCCALTVSMLAERECGLMSQVLIYKDDANNDLLRPLSYKQTKNGRLNTPINPSLLTQFLEQNKAKRCQDRWTALMFAAYYGNVDVVRLLVSRESKVQSPHYKHTALMLATMAGHLSCVELLIPDETGIKDRDGETALMLAVSQGNMRIVSLLAKHEVGLTNNIQETALFKAIATGHTDIAKLLLPMEAHIVDEEETTVLMLAASKGNSEIVKVLTEKSIGVGKKNKFGYTALMAAAQEDATECITMLLSRECRMTNANGMTALMLAAARNLERSVKLLINYELGIKDHDDDTALLIAIGERSEAAALLLAQTDEAYTPNQNDCYPIMLATQLNLQSVVCALIPMCDERIHYTNDLTPLMYAANQGFIGLVDILARAQHNSHIQLSKAKPLFVGSQDKDGWTALMFATDKGHIGAVEILAPIEHSMLDNNGNNALSIAVTLGNIDSVKLLIPYEGAQLLMSRNFNELVEKITDNKIILLLRQIAL